jgi:hAT family protein
VLEAWKGLRERYPRIAQLARDILAIPAASSGVEREFSIAGEFDQDNRSYSAKTLSALMICNHRIVEENLDMMKRYYLGVLADSIPDNEVEAEVEDVKEVSTHTNELIKALRLEGISDGEGSSDEEDEENEEDEEDEEEDEEDEEDKEDEEDEEDEEDKEDKESIEEISKARRGKRKATITQLPRELPRGLVVEALKKIRQK